MHTVGPGTAIYHPPEAGEGRYSAKIDVFSLGLTLMQLGLAEPPDREDHRAPVDPRPVGTIGRRHPLTSARRC